MVGHLARNIEFVGSNPCFNYLGISVRKRGRENVFKISSVGMIFISRTSEIELGHFSQFKNDKLKGQDTRHYH